MYTKMLITNFDNKNITSLVNFCKVKINKRFTGNMPNKFSSSLINTCKKGAGCAMNANVANSVANTNGQKKDFESVSTLPVKTSPTPVMPNLPKLEPQKKKPLLKEAEKKSNPYLDKLNSTLPENAFGNKNTKLMDNLSQTYVRQPESSVEFSIDPENFNMIGDRVLNPINIQTISKIATESLVEPCSVQKNNSLTQETQNTLDFLVKCGLLTEDYTKFTSKFYALPTNPSSPRQTLDLNCLNKNPIKFQLGVLNVSTNTIILSGLQNHINVFATITPTNKLIIGYLTSQKDNINIKLSEEQPFPTQNIGNKKQQMFHPLNIPMLISNNLIMDIIPYNEGEYANVNQQELGNSFITKEAVNDLLQNFYEKKVIPEVNNQKGSLQIYNGDGGTRENIEYALIQEEKRRNNFLKKAIVKYEHLKKELNENKLEKWLIDTKNNTDKETFEKLELAIKEYNAKFK